MGGWLEGWGGSGTAEGLGRECQSCPLCPLLFVGSQGSPRQTLQPQVPAASTAWVHSAPHPGLMLGPSRATSTLPRTLVALWQGTGASPLA